MASYRIQSFQYDSMASTEFAVSIWYYGLKSKVAAVHSQLIIYLSLSDGMHLGAGVTLPPSAGLAITTLLHLNHEHSSQYKLLFNPTLHVYVTV